MSTVKLIRTALLAGFLSLTGTMLNGPTEALACGGCFVPPEEITQVTGHRMVLSLSQQQTTLYDQIEYEGSPESFAWVLPIKGVAEIGLLPDLVFETLDASSKVRVQAPPPPCAPCDSVNAPSTGFSASASSGGGEGVNVLAQEVVGPYETVQLSAEDPAALTKWLQGHGYQIPASLQPVIADYIKDSFGFLAMKLVPGATIERMQPVSITTQGASPALPLRMVAAGTGAKTFMTLFVVAQGRYEPTNFPSFEITEEALVWDWDTSSSNYSKLRDSAFKASNGFAWQVESSIEMTKNDLTWPLTDAIEWDDAAETLGYVGMTKSEALLAARADVAKMFTGIGTYARVTRLRAELSRAALGTDLMLGASNNQEEKWPSLQAAHAVGTPDESLCPCGLEGSGLEVGLGSGPDSATSGPSGGGVISGCRVGGDPMRGAELGTLLLLAMWLGRRRRERGDDSCARTAEKRKGA